MGRIKRNEKNLNRHIVTNITLLLILMTVILGFSAPVRHGGAVRGVLVAAPALPVRGGGADAQRGEPR